MARGFRDEDNRERDKLVDIEALLIRVSDSGLGWLLKAEGKEVWVPVSQTENNRDGTFTMPEWLAKDKGLI